MEPSALSLTVVQ